VQQTRHHKTVAAIVAGPAQHGDRARLEARRDRLGHRAARILHQDQGRYPMLHRKGIGLGHFRGGEDLAGHLFAKYFSSRSSDCSINVCCLQKAKRTNVSGVPVLKKADSGISATPASRISRSQKAKSFSLVSLVMPAV